jgi:hypothetical protein
MAKENINFLSGKYFSDPRPGTYPNQDTITLHPVMDVDFYLL